MEDKLKKTMLLFARKTIAQALKIPFGDFTKVYLDEFNSNPYFSKNIGSFVTLHIAGNLRGCVGQILPVDSLRFTLAQNALSSAFRDTRFEMLSKDEFYEIEIEISLLNEPEKLIYKSSDDLLNKINKNIDGLIIKKNNHSATFLPQVWESLSRKEDFLSNLCLKAGLDADEWTKDTLKVEKYQVENFDEKIFRK